MRRALVALAALVAILSGCGGGAPAPPEIAFVTTRDGYYAIYGMTADGRDEHRLGEGEGEDETAQGLFFEIDPAWSRDGARLAFASKRDGPFHIFAMNADGTQLRRLTNGKGDDVKPSWSPDGRRILFARGSPGDLYVRSGDGRLQRLTKTSDVDEAEPSWSPDGEWIAYARRERGREKVRQIWVMRADGTDDRVLAPITGVSSGPTWSPDSERVAFASNVNDGNYEIYTIGVDGKGLRRLTTRSEDDYEPSWSPNGRLIAFSREGKILTVDLQGNETEVSSGKNDTSPAWRPVVPAPTDE